MDQHQNLAAIKLVVKHYFNCIRTDWRVVLPALLLPGIGSIFVFYVPPLFVGKILAQYGSSGGLVTNQVWSYVAWLAAAWLFGEILWRIGIHFLIKADVAGVSRLYMQAMNVSITGQNLGYLTAAPVASPERSIGAGVASGTGYGLPRTLLLGINLTF